MAVHLHPQLHHAGVGAPVDHHIVHRQGVKHADAVTHDLAVDQAAVVFLKLAHQHGCKGVLVVFQRDIGDKAQTPLVDANQRDAIRRELTANAQHGAVTADHQAQVTLRANVGDVQGGVSGDATLGSCSAFHEHLAAKLVQKSRDILQHRGTAEHAGRMKFAYQCDFGEMRCRVLKHRSNYIIKMTPC